LCLVEITHRARDVSFGVFELDQLAHAGNHHLGHRDLTTLLLDEPGDRVDVINRDGALEAYAAMDVGYESISAFISAFRMTFGKTPGQYFRAT